MEKYLNNSSSEKLDKIIQFIMNSKPYIRVKELKLKMKKDSSLMDLISEVKLLQKKYIKSGKDKELKSVLDKKIDILNKNRLYVEYNYYLEQVNKMIDLVNEELNAYFYSLTNSTLLEK